MKKEIGSSFYEYDIKNQKDVFTINGFDESYYFDFFISGRNAIKSLARILQVTNKTILIPEFTCNTVYEPFVEEKWNVIFFCINKDLTVNLLDINEKICKYNPSTILLHSYFGFNTLDRFYKQFSKKDITIIEDITQYLFSSKINFADYYVASLRKWFAIPSGGLLISKNKIDINKTNFNELDELFIKACYEKNLYMLDETKTGDQFKKYKKLFSEIEDCYENNSEIFNITPLSMKILRTINNFDINKKRYLNYLFLLKNIANIHISPIFKNISENVVPLYFPIYVDTKKNRHLLQVFLSSIGIFCPIIWPQKIDDMYISETGKYVYNHILCIPCDQRYNLEDMEFIIANINKFHTE